MVDFWQQPPTLILNAVPVFALSIKKIYVNTQWREITKLLSHFLLCSLFWPICSKYFVTKDLKEMFSTFKNTVLIREPKKSHFRLRRDLRCFFSQILSIESEKFSVFPSVVEKHYYFFPMHFSLFSEKFFLDQSWHRHPSTRITQ